MTRLSPTPTLAAAVRRVGVAYAAIPEADWPETDSPEWRSKEAAIDDAYVARKAEDFKEAVQSWELFALKRLRHRESTKQ